jgi:hypothetical protein
MGYDKRKNKRMNCPCCRSPKWAIEMKLEKGYWSCGCGFVLKAHD